MISLIFCAEVSSILALKAACSLVGYVEVFRLAFQEVFSALPLLRWKLKTWGTVTHVVISWIASWQDWLLSLMSKYCKHRTAWLPCICPFCSFHTHLKTDAFRAQPLPGEDRHGVKAGALSGVRHGALSCRWRLVPFSQQPSSMSLPQKGPHCLLIFSP